MMSCWFEILALLLTADAMSVDIVLMTCLFFSITNHSAEPKFQTRREVWRDGNQDCFRSTNENVSISYIKISPWNFEDGEGDVPRDASGRVGGRAAVHAHVLPRDAVDDEAVDPRPPVLARREAVDGDPLLGGRRKVARVLRPRDLGGGDAAGRALERRSLTAPHRYVLCG